MSLKWFLFGHSISWVTTDGWQYWKWMRSRHLDLEPMIMTWREWRWRRHESYDVIDLVGRGATMNSISRSPAFLYRFCSSFSLAVNEMILLGVAVGGVRLPPHVRWRQRVEIPPTTTTILFTSEGKARWRHVVIVDCSYTHLHMIRNRYAVAKCKNEDDKKHFRLRSSIFAIFSEESF